MPIDNWHHWTYHWTQILWWDWRIIRIKFERIELMNHTGPGEGLLESQRELLPHPSWKYQVSVCQSKKQLQPICQSCQWHVWHVRSVLPEHAYSFLHICCAPLVVNNSRHKIKKILFSFTVYKINMSMKLTHSHEMCWTFLKC